MSAAIGPYAQITQDTTRVAYSDRAVLERTPPTLAAPNGSVRVRPTYLVTASGLSAPKGHTVEELRTRVEYDQVIANEKVFAARRGDVVRLRFQTAENRFEIGTGFFVSPTIVQTSRRFKGYRVTGEFDDGFKVPDAQSKIFDGLIEGKLENLREGLRERFLPPRISPDPHHPHAIDDPLAGMRYELVKILDGLSHDLHADRLNPQNTDEPPLPICCDFQFLRIQNYKNPSFFVPGVPMGTQHVGIMGFCGEPDPTEVLLMLATETELKEKERSGRAILTVLEREREMRAGFHNYNNLTVSPATVVDTNSGNLSHPYRLHNGSVSTGASGAPVVRASQPQVFSYMHVSGTPHYVTNPPIQPTSTAVQQGELDEVSLRPDSDRFQNVMISVNHPEYRKLYQEIVWPEIRTIVDAPKFPGDVREALAFYVSNRE